MIDCWQLQRYAMDLTAIQARLDAIANNPEKIAINMYAHGLAESWSIDNDDEMKASIIRMEKGRLERERDILERRIQELVKCPVLRQDGKERAND